MNPPGQATEYVESKDYVSVINRSTGQLYFCKKNPETQMYEVVETSSTSLKIVNLQAKFSKVCNRTYKVILYATDTVTDKLGRYIFENNDFRPAPECHCDGCKINAYEFGDHTSIFTTPNGSPLILLDISWTGCFFKGHCELFVDPSSGVIGKYKRTGVGMVVAEQNQMIQLFPCKELSEPLNHLLISVRHCPHVDQNIYICKRAAEQVYLTFNRRHMRFETIECGCRFRDLVLTMYQEEKMVDHFASRRHGSYVGIFCSTDGKLSWKSFEAEFRAWRGFMQGERVVDCRYLGPHDLLLRYNFFTNDQEPFLDAFDPGHTKELLFTEPNPFGNIYWMVNRNHDIYPYKHLCAPFSIYGRSKQFNKQCQVSVYKDRLQAKDLLEGRPLQHRKHEDLVREINLHTCEKCMKNPKVFVESRRRSFERFSREALDDMVLEDTLAAYEATRSPPKSTAPPSPHPQQHSAQKHQAQLDTLQKIYVNPLPPHLVAKLLQPYEPRVPLPPPSLENFPGEPYVLSSSEPYYQMYQHPPPSTLIGGAPAEPPKRSRYYTTPPVVPPPPPPQPSYQCPNNPNNGGGASYFNPVAPHVDNHGELLMNTADLFYPTTSCTEEQILQLLEGVEKHTNFDGALCMEAPKEVAPKEVPTSNQIPRFRLVQGKSSKPAPVAQKFAAPLPPAHEPHMRRELMRTAKRMRDEEKEKSLPSTSAKAEWISEHVKRAAVRERLEAEWEAKKKAEKEAKALASPSVQVPLPPPPPPEEGSSSDESLDDEEYTDEEEEEEEDPSPQDMDTILESLQNRVNDLDVHGLD